MVMSQSVQQTGTTQWWSYQIQLLNTPLSKLKSEYLILTDHVKHFKNNPDLKKNGGSIFVLFRSKEAGNDETQLSNVVTWLIFN